MTLQETLKQQAVSAATVLQNEQDGLAAWRAAGRQMLEQATFPDRKTERWKYTPLTSLQAGQLGTLAEPGNTSMEIPQLGATHQLVIVNGNIPQALPSIAGVDLTPVDGETNGDEAVSVFSGFNAAILRNGLQIRVGKGQQIEGALHLVYISDQDTPSSCANRVEIDLGDNSQFTVIEHFIGRGPALAHAITRINVGANASLTHYRLQSEAADTLHIGELHIHQQRDSRVQSFQLMHGNTLRRNDVRVWMREPGADLVMRGVYLARESSHIDNQICIEHAAPHCTSDQIFKGIAGETAHAVFNGRIHIHPGAKGTDAQLSNKNLLLSNSAEIDSKPELEIYNDDVKCGHGTTVGQMDAQQLFYLQSRGIDADNAKRMLGVGFINELLLALPDENIADWARDWLSASL